jgi:hypothetical protein
LIYNLNPTQDLLRLMGKFLIHENVPARGACNVVDNPREGEVIQPFKKVWGLRVLYNYGDTV